MSARDLIFFSGCCSKKKLSTALAATEVAEANKALFLASWLEN
jgi:hypothetical protein